jgi:hypothetical protein
LSEVWLEGRATVRPADLRLGRLADNGSKPLPRLPRTLLPVAMGAPTLETMSGNQEVSSFRDKSGNTVTAAAAVRD